jgi:hypothetical protein
MPLKPGDKVYIVGGMYRWHGHGTYVRPFGKKMCTIKVNGDIRETRNLWLSSIQKEETEAKDNEQRPPSSTSFAEVVLTREQYDSLLRDIASLAKALNELQLKVNAYGD